MNKSLKSIVLSVLLLFVTILPHVQHLDQDIIDRKSAAIESMIARERYVLAVFTAMGIAQNILYLLPLYQWIVGEAVKVPLVAPENVRKISICQPSLFSATWFSERGNYTKHLFCTQDGWFTMLKSGFYLGGQLSVLFIMNKIAQDLQHPDTIGWYVSVKIPYKKRVEIIKELVKKLYTRSLCSEQRDFYHLSLQTSCKQIADFGENICAYMQYKSNSKALSEHQRYMAQASSRYLFNYHNRWLSEVGALLIAENLVCQKIEQFILSYESEIAYQIKLFASFES